MSELTFLTLIDGMIMDNPHSELPPTHVTTTRSSLASLITLSQSDLSLLTEIVQNNLEKNITNTKRQPPNQEKER